ncbi:hypothetical protein [Undibacterium sp. Ren11W]|uniref:hypothetical protein n=1 Tax=Undibacterium sp. Ren11W TaxID=3413045 RepID=UPI003BF40351
MLLRSTLMLPLFSLCMLSACDRLGLADPAKDAAAKEADARATGSACRHAGRGVEDCYSQNPDSARAAVFAGWKEMNDYMRENKIEEVKPDANAAAAKAAAAEEASSAAAKASEEASASEKSKSSKKSAKH